uniref:Cyclomaltodextrin glucanotransferase n=1 Tax=Lygus hesperus TaxID=30085 RepID=A0A0A9WUV2_LYGHE
MEVAERRGRLVFTRGDHFLGSIDEIEFRIHRFLQASGMMMVDPTMGAVIQNYLTQIILSLTHLRSSNQLFTGKFHDWAVHLVLYFLWKWWNFLFRDWTVLPSNDAEL